jgi:hypothetical protein
MDWYREMLPKAETVLLQVLNQSQLCFRPQFDYQQISACILAYAGMHSESNKTRQCTIFCGDCDGSYMFRLCKVAIFRL